MGDADDGCDSSALDRGLEGTRYAGAALVVAGSAAVNTALDDGFGLAGKSAALVGGGGAYALGALALVGGVLWGPGGASLARAGVLGVAAAAAFGAYAVGAWMRGNDMRVPLGVQAAFGAGWAGMAVGVAMGLNADGKTSLDIKVLVGGAAAAAMAILAHLVVLPWERRNCVTEGVGQLLSIGSVLVVAALGGVQG